ncbi:hypothetical protein [Actinokineospora pegani]|uniref:hypothetical protein n=1 Tax=Actinokineospora pegani TaxID=2654637 RepID=UPI001F16AAE9|nr:hypothetical protein [Actinokineospora pegani]
MFTTLIRADVALADDPPPGPPPPPTTPAPRFRRRPYANRDGREGVPDITGDPRLRQLVVDNAELAEDREVREAAAAALAGTDQDIMVFLNTGLDEAKARAQARKQEEARQNLAACQALRGTGGPLFNAEVERVFAGTDSDRVGFLLYGVEVYRALDDKATADARTRADQLRGRVTVLAASAGPEVQRTAQEALNAGDAAIAEYLRAGYQAAARLDAEQREQEIRDQEARERAAEELSDLAKRAALASQARQRLLVAHGNGVRALEKAANAVVLAGNEARRAEQILAANNAGGTHPADSFTAVKAETARQLANARTAATEAETAATQATVEANILVEVNLPYGAPSELRWPGA